MNSGNNEISVTLNLMKQMFEMKKAPTLSLLLFVIVGLTSCQKQKYCADCYEAVSDYHASDFCGTSDEVDTYIQELTSTGLSLGQAWSCQKYAE